MIRNPRETDAEMSNGNNENFEDTAGKNENAVVLILEDDVDLAEELEYSLKTSGFQAVACHTVRAFWAYVEHHEVDLLVVDLGLPDGYGVEVIREVRKRSNVPIIITSGRFEVEERVAGIEIGADDYLAKPYNSRELIAKLSRFLSRSQGAKYSRRVSRISGREVFRFNDYVLDVQSMSLTAPDGKDIGLTTLEFLLLKALVERPNIVLSRASLIECVHSSNWYGSDRKIDNLISRLRSKLAGHEGEFPVKAIRGIGYIFTADVKFEK